MHASLFKAIDESNYFRCLYVFKTFDKIVDLIYEKVRFVEPYKKATPASTWSFKIIKKGFLSS